MDCRTEEGRLVAEQAIAAYREARRAMESAREGEGMAVTESADLTHGRQFLRDMMKQLMSVHPEAQKRGPAGGQEGQRSGGRGQVDWETGGGASAAK